MNSIIRSSFHLLSLLVLISNGYGRTIGGSSVKELTTCSKYEFEERVLEKLVRIEYAVERHEEKMKDWEIKIDKSLNKLKEDIDDKMKDLEIKIDKSFNKVKEDIDNKMKDSEIKIDKSLNKVKEDIDDQMKTFSENFNKNHKRLENEELSRNKSFQNMLNKMSVKLINEELEFQNMLKKMSVKLSNEEQEFQNLATNFTSDSNIFFDKVMGNFSNLEIKIDKSLNKAKEEIDDNMKTFSKNLEAEELIRNDSFLNMVNKMSVKLNQNEQDFQDIVTNFTADSDILFDNVMGNFSNLEIKIDKRLNKVKEEIDNKMKTFSEKLEADELNRNDSFLNMLNKMSVKLNQEEQDFQGIVKNFTADSGILFNNLMEKFSNFSKDMERTNKDKATMLNNIVNNMNITVHTLVEETQIATDNQLNRVTVVLEDQNRINQTLISLETEQRQIVYLISHVLYDCTDVKMSGTLLSGVYAIFKDKPQRRVEVYCDLTTDGGGWTVIQRHSGPSVDFQRNWVDYENGFGDPHGDYWLGNTLMHTMTTKHKYELRIDLTDDTNKLKYAVYKTFRIGDSSSKYQLTIGDYSGDVVTLTTGNVKIPNKRLNPAAMCVYPKQRFSHNNKLKYAVYKTFRIGDSSSKYQLTIGDYSGDAGDQLEYHNGMKFSTVDQDNDQTSIHCASPSWYGPWWNNRCGASALNRPYSSKPYWHGINVIQSVMMIRRL